MATRLLNEHKLYSIYLTTSFREKLTMDKITAGRNEKTDKRADSSTGHSKPMTTRTEFPARRKSCSCGSYKPVNQYVLNNRSL